MPQLRGVVHKVAGAVGPYIAYVEDETGILSITTAHATPNAGLNSVRDQIGPLLPGGSTITRIALNVAYATP